MLLHPRGRCMPDPFRDYFKYRTNSLTFCAVRTSLLLMFMPKSTTTIQVFSSFITMAAMGRKVEKYKMEHIVCSGNEPRNLHEVAEPTRQHSLLTRGTRSWCDIAWETHLSIGISSMPSSELRDEPVVGRLERAAAAVATATSIGSWIE